MAAFTLIHTRVPHDEFIHTGGGIHDAVDDLTAEERGALYRSKGRGLDKSANVKRISGRWGSMLLIVGPEITAAETIQQPASSVGVPVIDAFVKAAALVAATTGAAMEALVEPSTRLVPYAGRVLKLTDDGAPITSFKEYTTMERYRGDYDTQRYVFLPPRPAAYPIKIERGNSVVKTLRPPGHKGDCIRILGGATPQQRAILIHEAPNVSWLIGCIGPRPKGEKQNYPNVDGNTAQRTVAEIMGELSTAGGKGSLFVVK